MEIIVYSKDGCPWCQKAKEFLTEKGANWREVKINEQKEREAFYDSLALVGRLRTMPQIEVRRDSGLGFGFQSEYIGGYTDMVDNAEYLFTK